MEKWNSNEQSGKYYFLTIFGNSFITQDYTEKSEKIQSKNIIGVRYVQLSGNMDYDDRRIVVRSFLAPEIDLIWSFTMK